MSDKRRYQFAEKVRSETGTASAIMAGISAVLMAIVLMLSFHRSGNAGSYVGGIAVTALLVAGYGFHLGIRSFSEKHTSSGISIFGSIACGILFIGWITFYLLGLR